MKYKTAIMAEFESKDSLEDVGKVLGKILTETFPDIKFTVFEVEEAEFRKVKIEDLV